MDKSLIGTTGRCAHCNAPFILQSPNNIYCTDNCMIAAQRLRRKNRRYNSMRLVPRPYQDQPVPPIEDLAKEIIAKPLTDEEIRRRAAAILKQEQNTEDKQEEKEESLINIWDNPKADE